MTNKEHSNIVTNNEKDIVLSTKIKSTVLVIVWLICFVLATNLVFILECFSDISWSWLTYSIIFASLAVICWFEKKYIDKRVLVVLFLITVLIAGIIYTLMSIFVNNYAWVFFIATLLINSIYLFKHL